MGFLWAVVWVILPPFEGWVSARIEQGSTSTAGLTCLSLKD